MNRFDKQFLYSSFDFPLLYKWIILILLVFNSPLLLSQKYLKYFKVGLFNTQMNRTNDSVLVDYYYGGAGLQLHQNYTLIQKRNFTGFEIGFIEKEYANGLAVNFFNLSLKPSWVLHKSPYLMGLGTAIAYDIPLRKRSGYTKGGYRQVNQRNSYLNIRVGLGLDYLQFDRSLNSSISSNTIYPIYVGAKYLGQKMHLDFYTSILKLSPSISVKIVQSKDMRVYLTAIYNISLSAGDYYIFESYDSYRSGKHTYHYSANATPYVFQTSGTSLTNNSSRFSPFIFKISYSFLL